MKALTVFCGSRCGNDSLYLEAASKFGRVAALHNIEIVYGGSSTGLMGAVADGSLEKGGKVTGIIPEDLMPREIAHQHLTELISVKTMHERKLHMYQRGNAFVALPGGIGTLEEFVEILTWGAIGHHNKQCALYNVANYYGPLQDLFDHMVQEGFLSSSIRSNIVVEDDPERLIAEIL